MGRIQHVSADAQASYGTDGYIALQLFDEREVDRLREMVHRVVIAVDPPIHPRMVIQRALQQPDWERFPSNPFAVHHVVNCVLAGDEWISLAADHKLVEVMSRLLGPALDLDMSFLRMRPPGLKMAPPWHIDAVGDYFDTTEAITALVYLTDMDEESGATWVVPRHVPLSMDDYLAGTLNDADFEAAGHPIVAPAGTVVFLSPTVIHRGGWNQGSAESGVLAFEYRSAGNRRVPESNLDLALSDMPVARPGWSLTGLADWRA
ncbi:phytanoyl-CoA dioxygenase family protein [Microbacterium sp. SORGH_AS_0421]|uniref:phytanoyl-CoA dioxygenase family protein n=1 Tax=Microbacterium sp. SORGH_AS_0421 TaxID=3041768 RepID=UPI002792850B|nr:phytanoyl-CoA dioxygenase family protein [Microbacterium sp. SORGH_AS_0421]MDQ1177766.1 ectoine hydroxylase-related dioxygenase (phytanoyl-CoA dioxygenase family) [Microbacterium sp. SORGH_AS_0421]